MRHDIQFLRGIAVLSVLLYHAHLSPISNGYLGVDVFFVISGFLITSIILRGLSTGIFSFSEFYLRRAKRLLPALYSTLIFTTLLAYVFLTHRQWNDYVEQFLGAITFTSNMVLPFQVGYFEDAAETKPLLHIWSLSLEEQYYFFLPLFLYLIPQKLRGWALGIGATLSLVLCLYLIDWSYVYWRFPNTSTAEWAFYLFPTRAWELLAGSLSAWVMLKRPSFSIPKTLKVTALVGLMILMCFSIDDIHPRGNAIMAILLSSIMILGRDNWLPNHWIIRGVERVGDWSYSLYLVHWPLLAFAQISFMGDVPTLISVALALISVPLAYLQYQGVEQRFRYGFRESNTSALSFLLVTTVIMLLLPLPAINSGYGSKSGVIKDFSHLRRPNYGMDEACDRPYSPTESLNCQTLKEPKFAVWGDSYAMHLVPGLMSNPAIGGSLIQMTMSVCGPVLDVAVITNKYDRKWAESCVSHNNRVLLEIQSRHSIKYVIMSSPFHQYFKNHSQSLLYENTVIPLDRELVIEQIAKTVELIRSVDKIPIIISPPPKSGFNIGDCLERTADNTIIFGRSDCNVDLQEYEHYDREIITALNEVQNRTGVNIVWLDSLLCNDNVCRTKIGKTHIYRDEGHLSYAGSKALFQGLDILSIMSSSNN